MKTGSRGATLLDTLVGVSLMLVVFVGITAVFQLSVDVVSNNKARTGALALAQERIEFIRSLSYNDVGTDGGVPSGNLDQEEIIALNGVSYTRRTLILYMDDPKDGLGGADANSIITDSKEAKVEVSWTTQNGGTRSAALTSRISPPGIEQAVPGGTLALSIVDSAAQPVSGALVSIVNATVTPAVDTNVLSNSDGEAILIGAPEGAGYEITVTKSGYSSAQTYDADVSNPNPDPGHLTVVDSATTASTFAIDLVGVKTIRTFREITDATWQDEFDDTTKVATSTGVTVTGGVARLAGSVGSYLSPGFVQSVDVAPTYLWAWDELSWNDSQPTDTDILYQVYYQGGSGLELVPDGDLPGNNAGFATSPVDISGLASTTYGTLRAHATLTTTNSSNTPSILDWSFGYEDGPEPLSNIVFTMRGAKTIGTDAGANPIYKYEQTLDSGAPASVNPTNLEWDTYTIVVDGATIGYDIAHSCEPQPRVLLPGGNVVTDLWFRTHSSHTLLVDVRDDTGDLIDGAQVRLYRGAYDTTQEARFCGQTFFSSLSEGTVVGGDAYSIQVSAPGHQTHTSTDSVDVSGASTISVSLTPNP